MPWENDILPFKPCLDYSCALFNPDNRKSFDEILRHKVFYSQSSVRASTINRKFDTIQERFLNVVESSFQRLEVQIMTQLGSKMDAVFQLIVNIQDSKYPYYCFCVPDVRTSNSIFEWAKQLKQSTLEAIGWKQKFKFYILDEAPILLPNICEQIDEPLPDKKGISVSLPGNMLVAIAPYMYYITKIFALKKPFYQKKKKSVNIFSYFFISCFYSTLNFAHSINVFIL